MCVCVYIYIYIYMCDRALSGGVQTSHYATPPKGCFLLYTYVLLHVWFGQVPF